MNRELVVATGAAYAAGEILRAGFGRTHEIQHKGANDIVTEVDRTAEAKIVDLLRSVFPGYGFLTEESGTIPSETDGRWIVDPLDGTVNYSRGFPCFCVSIAFERNGELEVGVIYDPLRDELYTASRGGGATLNGKAVVVSKTKAPSSAVISTGFPYDAWSSSHDNSDEVAPFVKKLWAYAQPDLPHMISLR